MKCPFCGHLEDRVIDSRTSNVGDVTRRRRECEACERRFTTYERVEYALPTVVKKDGRREPFDRGKIVASLKLALTKRPVSAERIESIADGIEREMVDTDAREVTSASLGDKVMARLLEVDQIAYVRFASVYRSFRDIGEFAAELGRMKRDGEDEERR
ncbi:MAG: transcriptional repressor NrdR [Myxococcales bacterium]|jgi:transcriptional repressor NrdR|nr:transcriptional repressor NrdR [Myxococcales bacterium]